MDKSITERVRELLLGEVRSGEMRWYYISVADERFRGGYFIEARGPTEAWTLLHRLGWYEPGCSTATYGPVPPDRIERFVPGPMRWCRLEKDQVIGLGGDNCDGQSDT